MVNSHKDLFIWQRSMDLVESIYRLTASLPASEQFGLIAQMRRSAVSVPSNIAEGYGRQATGEYRHHLLICRGSLLELETQVIIAKELSFVTNNEIKEIEVLIEEIAKMLNSILSKLRKLNANP